MVEKADVLVLGAGIVGVATALQLQKRGLATALVDRRGPGEETSFGNAGLIERSSIAPYMFPRDWRKVFAYALNRSADVQYDLAYLFKAAPWIYRYWRNSSAAGSLASLKASLPLIEHCLDEHRTLAEEAGVGHLIRDIGFLKVARGQKAIDAFASEAELARPYGIEHELLDASAIRAREPQLSDDIVGGVHLKETASVSDPYALTMGYVALFERLGGRLAKGDATTLQASGAGWVVKTAEGSIEARSCVVALGAWSNALAASLGYRLPMEVKRGYHMHYAPKGNSVLNHPVLDAENGYVLIPMAKGIRLTTGAQFTPMEAPKNPVQLAMTEPVARRLFPLGERLDAEPWMGRRPCFPDMVPVIGPAPRHKGLWLAYGHQHHGLTNAAVTGRLVADMVEGTAPFIDPAPYRLDRF